MDTSHSESHQHLSRNEPFGYARGSGHVARALHTAVNPRAGLGGESEPSVLLGHMEELDFPGPICYCWFFFVFCFLFFFFLRWLDLKTGGGSEGHLSSPGQVEGPAEVTGLGSPILPKPPCGRSHPSSNHSFIHTLARSSIHSFIHSFDEHLFMITMPATLWRRWR